MKPSDALLNFGRPIAYYPGLVNRLGSINAVVLFCQLFHHTGKEKYPDLGIYKTAIDIREETGLSVDEQRTARKHLRDRGVLIETEKRLEHRIYYRLDLTTFDDLVISSPEAGDSQSESQRPQCPGAAIHNSYMEQEITTKTTAENKPLPKAAPSVDSSVGTFGSSKRKCYKQATIRRDIASDSERLIAEIEQADWDAEFGEMDGDQIA